MIIELGHRTFQSEAPAGRSLFADLRAMVFESIGPVQHEISVPFHDSQVRGIALLIQTGWDQRWGTDAYWEPGPFLGEHLIFRMVRSGVRVVALDFSVSGERSSDTRLITGGQITVVENLRGLESLPGLGSRFTAIPLGQSVPVCPVEAFAEV